MRFIKKDQKNIKIGVTGLKIAPGRLFFCILAAEKMQR